MTIRVHQQDEDKTEHTLQDDLADTEEVNLCVCPGSTVQDCPSSIDGETPFGLVCNANGCNENGPTTENFAYPMLISCREQNICTNFALFGNGVVKCELADACYCSCNGVTFTGFRIGCDADKACKDVDALAFSDIECNGVNACAGVTATGDNYLSCISQYSCNGIFLKGGSIRCFGVKNMPRIHTHWQDWLVALW
jgi:hypothetical protein